MTWEQNQNAWVRAFFIGRQWSMFNDETGRFAVSCTCEAGTTACLIFTEKIFILLGMKRNKIKAYLPPYSLGLPSLKNLIVGYPWTWNLSPSLLWAVASTLPSLMGDSSFLSWPAALAYSGAKALQCPHHGASKRH